MKKLTATYRPAKGEAKMCEGFGGLTFFAGKPEEVIVEDAIYNELSVNRFFECSKPTDLTEEQAEKERQKKAAPQPASDDSEPAHAPKSQGGSEPVPHGRSR